MNQRPSQPASAARIRALAEFRYTLRRFLHFSEEAAGRVGMTPQQYVLLLQIAGAPPGTVTTVGYLAERLALRHHSVVELIDRCEGAGLVARRRDEENRRQVVLELTAAGERVLRELAGDHARELDVLGPELIVSLRRLTGLKRVIARETVARRTSPRKPAKDGGAQKRVQGKERE